MPDPKRPFHDHPPGLLGGLGLLVAIAATWLLIAVLITVALQITAPAEIAAAALRVTEKLLTAITVAGCALLLINHFR